MAAEIAAPARAQPDVRAGVPSGASFVAPRLKWALGLILPLTLALGWEAIVRLGLAEGRLMPPPSRIATTLYALAASGELWVHAWATLWRVAVGFALGAASGIVFGALSGTAESARRLLDPTLQALRAIPSIAWVPLFILWFGIGESPKVLLVAIGTTFPIYVNTYAAIRGVDAKLVEAGTTFGLDRRGLVRRVVLPGAVPGFLVGLRFALTGSWLIMIVAEQINARSGLGFLINEARSWYRTDIIVMGLAVYGLVGLTADALVRWLERTLLAWRRGFVGT